MTISRRSLIRLGAGLVAAASTASQCAWAQSYPTRPVRIVLGFPAGGLGDIISRLIAGRLSEQLGQSFVVENRPGAATNLATEAVVRAAADGHTLLLANSVNAINASVHSNLSFNFIQDFAPVAHIADAEFVLEVHPSVPATTVPQFIAYAKANPGRLLMASAGPASFEHLAGELFKLDTGVDLLHVPYQGSGPAVNDLVGGHVQVYFGPIAPSIQHIRAGTLRALAVTTAARSIALPDVPSVGEFLPGYDVSAWQGLVAPKDTPSAIIEKLNAEVNAALADPPLYARLVDLGTRPLPGSPSDFRRLIAADTERWAKVVNATGIKVD
jgi:tripartite-type tricarboxylate transporter receptor subunit TctC